MFTKWRWSYAVVDWLIAQIATQIFPFLEIPNWIVRLVIVLIAIGFPIALVIAQALQGDSAKARVAYQDFFNLWKNAEPNLPLLTQAKIDYGKLQ